MITGFNTNVRHGGRLFHVQTEDSGRKNPHVISHLYHGGTIMASQKSEYADLLESKDLSGQVRSRMEKQHKAMVARLKGGEFDAIIAERLEAAAAAPGAAKVVEEPSETTAPEEEPRPAAAAAPAELRTFGDGIVSERPLDEVILEYLVDKARGRAPSRSSREAAARPERGARSKG